MSYVILKGIHEQLHSFWEYAKCSQRYVNKGDDHESSKKLMGHDE